MLSKQVPEIIEAFEVLKVVAVTKKQEEMHFSTEKHSYRPSNPLSLITPEDELIMKSLYKWEIRGWLKKSASFFL